MPDLAHVTSELSALLKKNIAYVWLREQHVAFDKTKEIILANLQIRPFDRLLPTRLLTDASRLKGLGYCLLQTGPDDSISLIQCGSRSLNSVESRYSTTELECLAIYYACLLYTSPSPRDRG